VREVPYAEALADSKRHSHESLVEDELRSTDTVLLVARRGARTR
jgi:hypothetical protein